MIRLASPRSTSVTRGLFIAWLELMSLRERGRASVRALSEDAYFAHSSNDARRPRLGCMWCRSWMARLSFWLRYINVSRRSRLYDADMVLIGHWQILRRISSGAGDAPKRRHKHELTCTRLGG
jgi:hypothetical protein